MTRVIGLFRIDPDWIAFQFKSSKKKVLDVIQKFETMGLVVFSSEYSEVYLRHYLVKYQTLGGPPLMKLLKREMVSIRDRKLLRTCLEENRDFMKHRQDYYNATVQQFLEEALQDLKTEISSEELAEKEKDRETLVDNQEPMPGDPDFDYSALVEENDEDDCEDDFAHIPFWKEVR